MTSQQILLCLYAVPLGIEALKGWDVTTRVYGNEEFIGAIAKGNIFVTQFHPEKSGPAGARVLKAFLNHNRLAPLSGVGTELAEETGRGGLTRQIIACLDVRTNDDGDLVVTRGGQYDISEKVVLGGQVWNVGNPVDLAKRYFQEVADEVTFFNITSFRNCPLADLPMLEILRKTSGTVFVPLTIGSGIGDHGGRNLSERRRCTSRVEQIKYQLAATPS